jgi:adenylyltransferase/sulfurtransferase
MVITVVKCVETDLSNEEFEYYSRQLALTDIGYDGQLRIKNSKVCILGCGGLGVPTMFMLTAMGIGHIKIVDRDIVSTSDLHRQYIYDIDSIGLPKVEVASRKLRRLNPHVTIEPLAEPIIKRNIKEIIDDVDVAIDGLDNIDTRYLVNRTCYQKKIPYTFAGAIGSIANATTIIPDSTPCLECFFPGFDDSIFPKCSSVGIFPPVVSLISSIQVSEVITILLGGIPKLSGKLLLANLNDLSLDKINISRQENCSVCGTNPKGPPRDILEKHFEEECARDGRRTIVLTPMKKVEVDLEKLSQRLINEGKPIKSKGQMGISFNYSETITLSLLNSGLMIVQISPEEAKKDLTAELSSLYKSIMVEWLGVPNDAVPNFKI